jgi:hypothetical protein
VMVMPGDDDSMTKFDMAKSYPHLLRALGGEDGFDPTNCHKSRMWECLTAACKAFSLVNAKGKGTNGLVGNQVFRWLDWEKREKSEISAREFQKTFEEFKTVISILLTKYWSHHKEISTKDMSHSLMTKNSENMFFANCNTSPW